MWKASWKETTVNKNFIDFFGSIPVLMKVTVFLFCCFFSARFVSYFCWFYFALMVVEVLSPEIGPGYVLVPFLS